MKSWLKVQSIYKLLIVILIVFYIYLLVFAKGSLLELHLLKKQNEELQNQIAQMEEKTTYLLKKEQKLLTDSVYIDRVIRKKLGVAKKDEKIFILQTVK